MVISPPETGLELMSGLLTKIARHDLATPWFEPTPIVTRISLPWVSRLVMRPRIGSAGMRQLGLLGSGFFLSGHGGNLSGVHARTRGSAGRGHGIVFQHASMSIDGGSGHLPLHGGQFGGALRSGQKSLHSF